ncbi:MAG: HAD family hydrolase, partial [Gammaproteobacteria bacterium]
MPPDNRIGAVLFDLDGTLVDTAPELADAVNRLREEHGLIRPSGPMYHTAPRPWFASDCRWTRTMQHFPLTELTWQNSTHYQRQVLFAPAILN